jgi:hypothetical protein
VITIVRGEIEDNPFLVARVGLKEAGHAFDRCLNRVKNTGEGFRGRLSSTTTTKNGQISFVFDSPAEACLAAIEMQRRVVELMPTSGIRLSLRVALLSADNEAEAAQQVDNLLKMALPGQILCSRQVLMEVAVSVGLKVSDYKQKLAVAEGAEPIRVMQLLWHESEDDPNDATRLSGDDLPITLTSTSLLAQSVVGDNGMAISSVPPARPIRLLVRYGEHSLILDEKTPTLTIGREHHNNIVVNDSRSSRQHARLELRDDGYYWLTDMSTNGTFVAFADEQEVFLRKDNIALRGKGALSFGISTRDKEADPLNFEHI